jgi:hypothetical protein
MSKKQPQPILTDAEITAQIAEALKDAPHYVPGNAIQRALFAADPDGMRLRAYAMNLQEIRPKLQNRIDALELKLYSGGHLRAALSPEQVERFRTQIIALLRELHAFDERIKNLLRLSKLSRQRVNFR